MRGTGIGGRSLLDETNASVMTWQVSDAFDASALEGGPQSGHELRASLPARLLGPEDPPCEPDPVNRPGKWLIDKR